MTLAIPRFRIASAACAALALTGCPTVRMPELYHPGSAGTQRYNALQWDPYPLDDVAPPVAGGRPPEYERPIPEVTRGQAFTPKRPNLKPLAVPSFAPATAPVITAPPALPTAPPSPLAPPANVPYQSSSPPPVTIVPVTPNVRSPY
jgi:hypothetical protein